MAEPERLRPLLNSLWMAIGGDRGGGRHRARWAACSSSGGGSGRAGLIEGLLGLPWAVPGTVFAIALAALFSVRAPWALRTVLVGTFWLLPLAYLVRNLPVTGRALLAGFRQLDPALEEAAASLGAGRWRARCAASSCPRSPPRWPPAPPWPS